METVEAGPVNPAVGATRPRASVRYRMRSPQVEQDLRAKREHPQEIVFVRKTGQ